MIRLNATLLSYSFILSLKITRKTVYCGGVKSTYHYNFDRLDRLTDAAFERVTKPQRLLLGGGYLTLSDNIYHHYITDYQGNVVLVINTGDRSIEQQTGYYPYGMPHGDAVGADAQPNKYSGKRLQTFAGMDTYDFHARQLPIGIPRFDRPDPLAEKFRQLGLYTYCAGDPVNIIDPSGQIVIILGELRNEALSELQKSCTGGINRMLSGRA